MALQLQYPTENERTGTPERMPPDGTPLEGTPSNVATWAVAPGDTVVVRGTFNRAEIRAYVDLIEHLHPDAGLVVLFLPPGVGLERAARMAEGRRDRSSAGQ